MRHTIKLFKNQKVSFISYLRQASDLQIYYITSFLICYISDKGLNSMSLSDEISLIVS